jgi:hypothetical protein
MKQRDLIDDNDIPLLDDNHTEAFIQLGCFYASKSENKKKFKDAYDDILKDLKNKYASKPSIDTRFEVDIRRGRLFPDFNSPHPDFGYPR